MAISQTLTRNHDNEIQVGKRPRNPRWVLGSLLVAFIVASALAVMAVAGSFSGQNAATQPPPSLPTAPAPSATASGVQSSLVPSGVRDCQSSDLGAAVSIAEGAQVAPGLSAGALSVTNESSSACELTAFPVLHLLNSAGEVIAGEVYPNYAKLDLTIQPGSAGAKVAELYWQNWCGINPRPLQVSLVLPNGGGSVNAPYGDAATPLPSCSGSSNTQFYATGPVDTNSLFGNGGPTDH
jgi:hypothetical protein